MECCFALMVMGNRTELLKTKLFVIWLMNKNGEQVEVCAFGIERITSNTSLKNWEHAKALFLQIPSLNIYPPNGKVNHWLAWVTPVFSLSK